MSEKLDCIHGARNVHLKHTSESLMIFNHVRDMRAEGIACHCNHCEFTIRLMRAVKNNDPYLAPNMISMARRDRTTAGVKRMTHGDQS